MDNIIKNPTFIAVIAGVIAYSYIIWRKNERNKKSKKNKKNKDNNEILIGGVVAAIAWLITYGYVNHNSNQNNNNINQPNQPNQINTVPTYKLVKDISDTPRSFTLMNPTGGISMPLAQTQMPEIFINNF
jgi:heme/copper-type cytochrome/quinol oxidase subunit 2